MVEKPAPRSIKIDPRFKGKWHYEEYLLKNHKKEIRKYSFERNFPNELRVLISKLYELCVDKENILNVYTHPPNVFLHHLCNGTLYELEIYTSIHQLK